jgi:hypothetical protein
MAHREDEHPRIVDGHSTWRGQGVLRLGIRDGATSYVSDRWVIDLLRLGFLRHAVLGSPFNILTASFGGS